MDCDIRALCLFWDLWSLYKHFTSALFPPVIGEFQYWPQKSVLKPEWVTVCSFANTRWLYGIEIPQVSSRKGELVGTQGRLILEPWDGKLQPDLNSQKKELSRSLGGCSWFCIVLLSAEQLPVLTHGFPAFPRTSAAKFCDASGI